MPDDRDDGPQPAPTEEEERESRRFSVELDPRGEDVRHSSEGLDEEIARDPDFLERQRERLAQADRERNGE